MLSLFLYYKIRIFIIKLEELKQWGNDTMIDKGANWTEQRVQKHTQTKMATWLVIKVTLKCRGKGWSSFFLILYWPGRGQWGWVEGDTCNTLSNAFLICLDLCTPSDFPNWVLTIVYVKSWLVQLEQCRGLHSCSVPAKLLDGHTAAVSGTFQTSFPKAEQ